MKLSIAICKKKLVKIAEIHSLIEAIPTPTSLTYTIDHYTSGTTLLAQFKQNTGSGYDMIFLGMHFDDMNGIELSRKLRHLISPQNTILIFVSHHENLAKDVIPYAPYRFLAEPLDPSLFQEALESALASIKMWRKEIFTFTANATTHRLPLSEIYYFKTSSRPHRVQLATTNGHYEFYGSIRTLEKQLNSPEFLKVSSSALVNTAFIQTHCANEVCLLNGDHFSISEKQKPKIRKQLRDLLETKTTNITYRYL